MLRELAVSTALFDGHQMAMSFAEIASAGCQRVEPAFIAGYTEFTEETFSEAHACELACQAAEAGVIIAAISAHMDLGAPEADTALRLVNRIRFAAACGSKVLITNAGLKRDADRIAKRVESVLALCEELDLILALENPGHGTGSVIYDARSGQSFLARFAHPSVRLNYDAGNVYSYSGFKKQPNDDLIEHGQRGIGYVHLKDLQRVGPDWTFCSVGSGAVDYKSLLQTLRPDVPMSVELPLRLRRPGGGAPIRQSEPVPLPVLRNALQSSLKAIAAAQR